MKSKSLENKTKSEKQEWRKIQLMGKKKFIFMEISKGALFGLAFGIITHFLEINFDTSKFATSDLIVRLVIHPGIFSLAGFFHSYLKWRSLEKRYS